MQSSDSEGFAAPRCASLCNQDFIARESITASSAHAPHRRAGRGRSSDVLATTTPSPGPAPCRPVEKCQLWTQHYTMSSTQLCEYQRSGAQHTRHRHHPRSWRAQ
eukprot:250674-Rhodomonas_salina.1